MKKEIKKGEKWRKKFQQEQEKIKCKCACHENKLGKPYEHDTKCCDDMNGFVTREEKIKSECKCCPQEPPSEWEKEINEAYQDFLDVCNRIAGDKGRTGTEASIALERVKIKISAQIAKARQETIKQVLDSLPKEIKIPDDILESDFPETQRGTINYGKDTGFNSALAEVKQKLEELLKIK